MLTRIENGVTWTHSYNAQNRLAAVSDGTDTWSFVYDGDGVRVKQVNPDGSITLFLMGGLYTVEDAESGSPAITTTYTLAGQKVAVREGGTLSYLVTDHLGSVIALLDSNGDLIAGSEQRYYPFGAPRMEASSEADWSFTGQRTNVSDFGLLDYNARFYSPALGRFTQPDSIVPGGPQGLNRYSYVYNSPVNYTDPDGHVPRGGHCADGIACNYGIGGSVVGGGFDPGNYPATVSAEEDVEEPSDTILVFCGSFGNPATIGQEGPECFGENGQMPDWGIEGAIPVQYPGSKYQQSLNALGLDIPLDLQLILVCYSSGTEACLMYAMARVNAGGAIQAIALLGPTFTGKNEQGIETNGFQDWSPYLDSILKEGTDVLIVDDGWRFWKTNGAQNYAKPTNASGDFRYQLIWGPHYDFPNNGINLGTNEAFRRDEVLNWIKTNSP